MRAIMKALPSLVAIFFVSPLFAEAPKLPSYLNDYVSKDDGTFAWKIVSSTEEAGNRITQIKLTSQKWQDELWEHDIQIFVPKGVKPTATVVLYNDGGTVNSFRTAFGLAIAEKAGAPVVFVLGVPKQPLYGKREDAL